ncbi:hypothetical protein L211DRAFT_831726 [Terfezia boudieri ATCC MYA-4762]|uniref:Uncharacterized protein n=1 Tax=Terfezia boudieri ATCC MYA-4762 TaxID=1051890 RepID=A0A3N4L643_9PEZI|nr:hypothetical protein L211DRAFT_831726 [Terfezia boudieri ATCC MYA-4762]
MPGHIHNYSRSPRIGSKGWVYRALVQSTRSGEGLDLASGLSYALGVAGFGWFRPSCACLTTNLELV